MSTGALDGAVVTVSGPDDLRLAWLALGLPITHGAPRLKAVIAVDHRAGDDYYLEPILAFDFYPKEEA